MMFQTRESMMANKTKCSTLQILQLNPNNSRIIYFRDLAMSKTHLVMAHFDRELAELLQLNSFPVQYFNGKLKNAERTPPKLALYN